MRSNHVPLRTCVACRSKGPQQDFVRVTRLQDATLVAGTSRQVGGRGAYLCRKIECFETGLERGALERSLKGRINGDSRAELLQWARAELIGAPTN